MASEIEARGTVSRGAYFGGLAAGSAIALFGLSVAPALQLPSLLFTAVEVGLVYLGIRVATGIWRRSAAESLTLEAEAQAEAARALAAEPSPEAQRALEGAPKSDANGEGGPG